MKLPSDADERCAVAIVGMAARFPGAPDVATFWRNLCAGTESISALDDAELEDGFPSTVRAGETFVRARSVLEGVEDFDAGFFAMHARDAELTDPQHRVFLECCWESLEDAGCDPGAYPGSIGVVGGCSINSYLLRNVLADAAAARRFTDNYQVDDVATLIGAGSDFLATRVAYKLDLRGPALTVQSACSTSLLAVAQACQALMLRQADVMLAGAVSISFPQKRGYLYLDGGMVSPDGHCRTFDAQANGTVFGAGAGVVVLKRLDDALRDGDSVYAVIRGFGVNNDGSAKVGYTAPSAAGQTAAVAAAHAMAGFDARSIRYVECHGTATPLGDPIEIAALTKAFGASTTERNFCAVGSAKPNVGHLDAAAGMAGLIKTCLCVREGQIPPTLHYAEPNPRIDFARSPFYVNSELRAWPQDDPRRRAGVSAFGLGGTNVHLVLEAAPQQAQALAAPSTQLLVASARSEAALQAACKNLAAHLRSDAESELADVAFTLQTGRRGFPIRCALTARTVAEAAAKLERFSERPKARSIGDREPAVAFMFPGQGAQYVGMGSGLYQRLPAFAQAFDRCAEILAGGTGIDLHALVYPATETAAASLALKQTAVAQPALFAVEYALARTWMSWGITPAAMIGHSVGEFVAATLAGVMTLEDALLAVAERGRLMQALPAGGMLAVRLGEEETAQFLNPALALAAVNSPALSVIAGPLDALADVERVLVERGVTCRRLETSHAFHSAMIDGIVAPFERHMRGLALSSPAMPYISCVTGDWVSPGDASAPGYWAEHARRTVRFGMGLRALCESGVSALIEVGPGSALATFAAQGAARDAGCAVTGSLPTHAREYDDLEAMLESLGTLWASGAHPEWPALHRDATRRRVHLPTYPFERARYWIDALPSQEQQIPPPEPVAVAAPSANDEQGEHDAQRRIVELLEELSGERIGVDELQTSFLQLGFDSLFLGRFVKALQQRFSVSVTFRQLLGELPSIAALCDHLRTLNPPRAAIPAGAPQRPERVSVEQHPPSDEAAVRLAAFRPGVAAPGAQLLPAQRAHVEELIARTVARTKRSKELTAAHRPTLADPRVAAGFRAEWKEMIYPVTCVRAKGSRIWDVDGNEYIDLLNGFGQTAFGHAPDFVVTAVAAQLHEGFAIGPQTDLAGEAAALLCEMTGNERATFCNTGSEAVMAALRVARTVTGRSNIVMFEGSYHGQFDEVLVKGSRTSQRALPVAPGIPSESVANVTVLPYGDAASLAWIRANASSLAAVLVEPVQSRHPALQPREFLRELRSLTQAAGTALIFDEVVTGFRVHPAGIQGLFGIRADLTTYGKVVGGGMPIGILAGDAAFMDALDGGMWQFGDDSVPEVAPTFVAGTFVRHPLAMAAVVAVLRYLRERGVQLQEALSKMTDGLVMRLNAALAQRALSSRVESFGSIMFLNFANEGPLANLVFAHLRARGIYVQEGFPCFLTTEHSQQDVDAIVAAFSAALDELLAAGILVPSSAPSEERAPAAAALEVKPTESQTEIWLVAQLGDVASCAFNESLTLRFEGAFDERAFASAWNALIARHEALRATFDPTGETMRIGGKADFVYETVDCSAAPDPQRELQTLVSDDARRPFDLVAGPLVRGQLVRMGAQSHAFIFSAHHIVCDGWSVNVLLEEFAKLYAGYGSSAPAQLPEPLAFSEYARSQHALDAAEGSRVESYWRAQFAEPAAVLDLPTDRPRPAVKSFSGATRSLALSRSEAASIKNAGARAGCTLFVTLLASFAALLGRLAEQRDVVIGIPAAGQSLLEDEVLVGHCVNFLPIRSMWSDDATLSELLGAVRQRVLEAYEHQGYTLGTLVRQLAPPRESNRTPLAEVQFNLERLSGRLQLPGLTADVAPNPKAAANFDLFLNVIESDDGLRVDCDYSTDVFDAPTIDRWLECYRGMLHALVDEPERAVAHARYLPAAQQRALRSLNETAREYPRDSSIVALFEKQAAAQPDEIAAICGDEQVTYRALERRANRLAHRVHRAAGGHGRLVGLCMERSIDMLVALLAIQKAGCAYVPLDPSHPPARLRHILSEARATVLIASGSGAQFAPGGTAVIDLEREAESLRAFPDAALGIPVCGDDLAYVIFTSGSTGMPKGVEITHRSVVNLLASMALSPGIARSDVLVAVTTVAFDIAALELFLPLSAGARVVIAQSAEARDGFRLLRCLERSGATIVQATPATWQMLLAAGLRSRESLKMLCGGEALSRELADELLQGGGELWNMYGPTETTIWSACKRVAAGDGPITVGTPIANTQFYVLDRFGEQVPVGKPGELHIGGDGVALGYRAQPALSAERFVANPFGSGRLYRTGDSARVLATDDVEILGRVDQQVKVRGFRVELGEIEAHLSALSGVASAAVALRSRPPEHAKLVGYFVAAPGASLSGVALHRALAERLPEYMIPTSWVALAELPRLPNGKLDRAALPAPNLGSEGESEFVAPHTALERALCDIWAEVLGRERIGTTDDIFALGADSIQLFKITARANRQGIPLMAKVLFTHRTIAAVAGALDGTHPQVADSERRHLASSA